MLQQTSNILLALTVTFFFTGCGLFAPRPDSPDKIIEKASTQKIFYASYDSVWKAAHSAIKYTIANENQDFGVIETDYIKTVDGWLPPNLKKTPYISGRYKLVLAFAKGTNKGKESTRVSIEKKIEVFRDFISETQIVPSDGLEEQSIFYRIGRELIIDQAIKKAASVSQ